MAANVTPSFPATFDSFRLVWSGIRGGNGCVQFTASVQSDWPCKWHWAFGLAQSIANCCHVQMAGIAGLFLQLCLWCNLIHQLIASCSPQPISEFKLNTSAKTFINCIQVAFCLIYMKILLLKERSKNVMMVFAL